MDSPLAWHVLSHWESSGCQCLCDALEGVAMSQIPSLVRESDRPRHCLDCVTLRNTPLLSGPQGSHFHRHLEN